MIYSKINNDDVLFFQKAISDNNVFLDDKTLDEYSHDETEDLKFYPSIVLKPNNTNGLEILKIFQGKDGIHGASFASKDIT